VLSVAVALSMYVAIHAPGQEAADRFGWRLRMRIAFIALWFPNESTCFRASKILRTDCKRPLTVKRRRNPSLRELYVSPCDSRLRLKFNLLRLRASEQLRELALLGGVLSPPTHQDRPGDEETPHQHRYSRDRRCCAVCWSLFRTLARHPVSPKALHPSHV
jgi:hypothetical protein